MRNSRRKPATARERIEAWLDLVEPLPYIGAVDIRHFWSSVIIFGEKLAIKLGLAEHLVQIKKIGGLPFSLLA